MTLVLPRDPVPSTTEVLLRDGSTVYWKPHATGLIVAIGCLSEEPERDLYIRTQHQRMPPREGRFSSKHLGVLWPKLYELPVAFDFSTYEDTRIELCGPRGIIILSTVTSNFPPNPFIEPLAPDVD